MAAATFLDALIVYLHGLKRLEMGRVLNRSDATDFVDAVRWLCGRDFGGLSLRMVADALELDLPKLYAAPHQVVVLQVRARKSGRRRREDYQ